MPSGLEEFPLPSLPITQLLALTSAVPVLPTESAMRPLAVTAVILDGGFWGDLQALNRSAIIPHGLDWVARLGWLGNLERAADRDAQFEHKGREFADSEIYKLIEAMSWEQARNGDASELDDALESFIDRVVAAQDPDGYLHTLFGRPWQQPRYSDFKWGHELYCFGHLIQAAVANHRATGSEKFLAVARRVGDHVVTMFGPDGLNKVCGHAEIELGLVELYRETGDRRYLDQASVFVERRGTGTLPLFEFGTAYWQDDMPVRAATVLRGHAVRALYLAAGAVDVAVETRDTELLEALKLQWENTVARRTYITGGMGSHHMDEAYGDDFVLPPDRSYCETCAGVASIMFSWRLLLATGDVKYADLIERTLYNVVATSPARDGRSFFYANTLHQRIEGGAAPLNEDGVCIRGGASGREAWFEVSCCPPNVARTLASLSSYVATTTTRGLQIHQYATGRVNADLDGGTLTVDIRTEYPSAGRIDLTIAAAPQGTAELSLRVPVWASDAIGRINGMPVTLEAGVWLIRRLFAIGDVITLDLPITPRFTHPDHRIDAVRGTVAVERGPLVLALESLDIPAGWSIDNVAVDLTVAPSGNGPTKVSLRRVTSATSTWPFYAADSDQATGDRAEATLVPYHDWASRGPSTMRIWMPTIT
jgi:DUF1680 family protein